MVDACEPTLHLAIIGGGIAGLAFAIGLAKHPHLTFHVYESVAQYTDIGAGLALHKNALVAMDLIDPRIKVAYFRRALVMAGEEDEEMSTQVLLGEGPQAGEVVAELGRAKGRRTIARSDLLDELLSLIPCEQISFGKRLVEMEDIAGESVRMRFADGTVAVADGVVGADGVRGLTRRYILGEGHPQLRPQNPEGWSVHSRQVPMELAMKTVSSRWRRTVPIFCGRQGHVNLMPLHRGQTMSIIVVTRTGVAADGSSEALEARRFHSYGPDVRAAVQLVAEDPGDAWDLQDHASTSIYSRGAVGMIGDAAHACLPFIGNGAAQAFEDAAVLAELFGRCESESDIPSALVAYHAVRQPRCSTIARLARDFGRLYDFVLDGVGDDPTKMMEYLREAASITNDFDVASQNQEAVTLFQSILLATGRDRPS